MPYRNGQRGCIAKYFDDRRRARRRWHRHFYLWKNVRVDGRRMTVMGFIYRRKVDSGNTEFSWEHAWEIPFKNA